MILKKCVNYIICLISILGLSNNGYTQGFTAQLVHNSANNTLSLYMTSSVGVPIIGTVISTISMIFVDAMGNPVTGVSIASTNYTMTSPAANGQTVASNTALPSPDDWSGGGQILVAVYNVPMGMTASDFNIQAAGVGPPPEDPTMSAGIGAGFNQTIVVLATLPIELLSFNAKNKQSHVALSWVTASEINNSHFEIERSADGNDFDMIATVDGAGNSSQTLEYSYNDMTPLNGINYYRLVNVDFDETRHFNEIRSVDFVTGDDDSNTISVYPNPVTNSFSVVSQGEIDGQTVRLLDTQGRLVSELPYRDGMIVDMDDMAAGIYRLMIISSTNETVHVQQVLKN